jgi:hypothetical protein
MLSFEGVAENRAQWWMMESEVGIETEFIGKKCKDQSLYSMLAVGLRVGPTTSHFWHCWGGHWWPIYFCLFMDKFLFFFNFCNLGMSQRQTDSEKSQTTDTFSIRRVCVR